MSKRRTEPATTDQQPPEKRAAPANEPIVRRAHRGRIVRPAPPPPHIPSLQHHIEVENFKSYSGQQVIGPFTQFSAVIGPNGAGTKPIIPLHPHHRQVQSHGCNILRSWGSHGAPKVCSKILLPRSPPSPPRGVQLRDLVFSADIGKEAASHRRASVSLIYEQFEDGPSTSFDVAKQWSFRRIITPSGSSEYVVNGKKCTREDYTNVLDGLGIIVQTRNFLVFQGDVENIASRSPSGLKDLIEQISGSDVLSDDYNNAKVSKDLAEENTVHKFRMKKGVAMEKKQYKEMKVEAERFETLLATLVDAKRQWFLWQIFHIEKDLNAITSERVAMQSDLEQFKGKQAQSDSSLAAHKQRIGAISKTVLNLQKKLKTLEKDMAKTKPGQIKVQESIIHLKQRIKQSQVSLKKVQLASTTRSATVEALTAELDTVTKAKAAFETKCNAQLEELGAKIGLDEAQLKQYYIHKDQASKSAIVESTALTSAQRSLRLVQEKIQLLTSHSVEHELKIEHLNEQLKGLHERDERLVNHIAEYEHLLEGLVEKHQIMKSANDQRQHRQNSVQIQLNEASVKLRDAKADQRESERDTKFKDTLDSLKRLFPGVHGRILDLCKPTMKKYNVAVTGAMGKHMDSIVCDSESTAIECIRYMKEQRLGTATFLPLDTIRSKQLDERLRSLGPNVLLVFDALSFDAMLTKAVLFAVGNTLLCDDLQTARRLAFGGEQRLKVVTLDGTVIQKSGIMQGGVSGLETRARRWQSKDLTELRQSRDAFVEELRELALFRKEPDSNILAQIEGMQNRLNFSKTEKTMNQKRINANESELSVVKKKLSTIRSEIDALTHASTIQLKQVEELDNKVKSIELEVFKGSNIQVVQVVQYEEERLKVEHDKVVQILAYDNQISKLQQQLDYESSRDVSAPLQLKTNQLKQDESKLVDLEAELQEIQKKSSKKNEAKNQQTKELEQHRLEKDKLDNELKQLKQAASNALAESGKIYKALAASESQLEQLKNKKHNVFQLCSVSEILLPVLGGSSLKTADEIEAREEEEEGTKRRRLDAMLLDFSSLPKKLTNIATITQYEEADHIQITKINEIEAEMERMAPNLKAMDRLGGVTERLKVHQEEFEQARQLAQSASRDFERIRQERSNRFTGCFEHLCKRIDVIYKDLTRSIEHPQGGTAFLTLENTEEPYLYGVKFNAMPPMKRFRDMEQLSGGEKAVAALALIFAIHSYQPSPFFVLDEIDASLDYTNVQKVVSYIQTRAAVDFQCIVISLKDSFYEKAESLVGVYREPREACSKVLTLDLKPYSS